MISKLIWIITMVLLLGVIFISITPSIYSDSVEKIICNQNFSKDYDFIYFNESQTDSMYPTINRTSIAYIEPILLERQLNIGDIINFVVPEWLGCSWVHRIIDIKKDSKGIYYVTKGDNNIFQDWIKIRIEDIRYKITRIK